ncbi:PREDICTED: EF-hand calcium-binding domain-containing protein 12 [Calidris pugnax]|uniref:EF-hand calcium-binding domain-containing protein 12 n=1 Tax=Calidris pugnax TaxID=198806 RepID=UPI00071C7AA9|nr:PREDICTED: EF-hand calcium-binding domain-containing protein 12 [Calidris pugnax]
MYDHRSQVWASPGCSYSAFAKQGAVCKPRGGARRRQAALRAVRNGLAPAAAVRVQRREAGVTAGWRRLRVAHAQCFLVVVGRGLGMKAPGMRTQSKNVTNLVALLTNIELCSMITFPTLKKLSTNDVVTIWKSVSNYIRRQLLKEEPQAVSVTGLGTFYIKKCHFFENGKMITFQKPVFSLSRTVAQISELQHASIPVPGEMKKVSVSYKKTHLEVPYSEKVAQHCVQETLDFLYFILKKKEDMDFVLKDVGTLAIRGTEVTMTFCEDLLLSLNNSRDTVEKLLTKKLVISDKEVTLFPSRFGRVHQLPQFEMRVVPRRVSLTDEETSSDVKKGLSSMGKRGTEGRQHKETPFKSPELPLLTSEEHGQTGQLPQEEEDSFRSPETTSNTQEGQQAAEAWTQLRRHLRTDLESLGDMERWLTQKPALSQQEKKYLYRIKALRAARRGAVKSAETNSLDNKDSPIECKEKCPMPRTGDRPVDEHCLLSTMEADFGELVDRYRSKTVAVYMQSSKQCEERDVSITKPTLQKGLLHPGDKIIKEGGDIWKIRQPGGYYSTGRADAPSPESTSRSGSHGVDTEKRHLQRKTKQETSSNKFWPGHLLDKLYLYFPEKQHNRAHPLFSCVRPTKPVYHSI